MIKKIDILRIITSASTKEQTENVLKAANNKDTQEHKDYLEILEKISRAQGKISINVWLFSFSPELKLLNNKNFLKYN